jgi:transcriptional regulator of arginine metabolism
MRGPSPGRSLATPPKEAVPALAARPSNTLPGMNKHHPQSKVIGKPERQRLISSVVSRRRVGSQHELAAALARAGCEVTQATISRDIRELRLEKTIDALGRPRYVLPGRSRAGDPHETLNGVLRQFGSRATAAQNIVVVQSELGSAPAIGRALDQLEHPKIVGTLAGDDTCLVITRSVADARAVARELGSALG